MNHAIARLSTFAALTTLACSPTEPRDFLDARFVLQEPVVRSGAVSSGRVEVTNHGAEPIEIEAEACPPRVLLFDRRGNGLGQPAVACPLALTAPVTIEPGETSTYIQGWIARNADGEPVPAGTYHVQVWIVPLAGGSPVSTNRALAEVEEEQAAPPP